MKYSVAAVAFAAIAAARSFSDIPECARNCLSLATTSKTNCTTADFSCVCKNFETIENSATVCVVTDCGTDDAINRVLPAARKLCKDSTAGNSKFSPAARQISAVPTPAAATSLPTLTIDTTITTTECPTTMSAAAANATIPYTTPVTPVTAGAPTLGSIGAVVAFALGALVL